MEKQYSKCFASKQVQIIHDSRDLKVLLNCFFSFSKKIKSFSKVDFFLFAVDFRILPLNLHFFHSAVLHVDWKQRLM